MFYMSFWSHIASIDEAADGNLAQGPLTTILGTLWLIAMMGLVLSLMSCRRHVSRPR
jgi:hypothetical protein